jgi:membrane protein DedA with SNARE-associated domain
MHLFGGLIDHLLQHYGYWTVFGLVLLETTGIPAPGETALVAAGAYAGATHKLSIALVVGAACAAAIIGDNLGFWIGREGGWRLLCRYGKVLHVEDWMLKVGVYVFRRHGAKIVFFGRFIPILRTWGALLTGVNRYPWKQFVLWNAAGGICWGVLWGMLAYAFGSALERVEPIAAGVAFAVALAVTVGGGIVVKKQAEDLRACAEREFPGSVRDIDKRLKQAA